MIARVQRARADRPASGRVLARQQRPRRAGGSQPGDDPPARPGRPGPAPAPPWRDRGASPAHPRRHRCELPPGCQGGRTAPARESRPPQRSGESRSSRTAQTAIWVRVRRPSLRRMPARRQRTLLCETPSWSAIWASVSPSTTPATISSSRGDSSGFIPTTRATTVAPGVGQAQPGGCWRVLTWPLTRPRHGLPARSAQRSFRPGCGSSHDQQRRSPAASW